MCGAAYFCIRNGPNYTRKHQYTRLFWSLFFVNAVIVAISSLCCVCVHMFFLTISVCSFFLLLLSLSSICAFFYICLSEVSLCFLSAFMCNVYHEEKKTHRNIQSEMYCVFIAIIFCTRSFSLTLSYLCARMSNKNFNRENKKCLQFEQ